jgi:predicted membrane chloride channel (bestrophin family)
LSLHWLSRARFGPGAAGAAIAEQFGKMGDNLPLDALCRKIDIDPRKSLGQPRFLLG